jgi:hypothetical protein
LAPMNKLSICICQTIPAKQDRQSRYSCEAGSAKPLFHLRPFICIEHTIYMSMDAFHRVI